MCSFCYTATASVSLFNILTICKHPPQVAAQHLALCYCFERVLVRDTSSLLHLLYNVVSPLLVICACTHLQQAVEDGCKHNSDQAANNQRQVLLVRLYRGYMRHQVVTAA